MIFNWLSTVVQIMFQRNDHYRYFANLLIPFNISFEFICFLFKKNKGLARKWLKKGHKKSRLEKQFETAPTTNL